MSQLEAIQQQVLELTQLELNAFEAWFNQLKQDAWDQQIAADLDAGHLDVLIGEALEDYRTGRVSKR